MAVNSELLDRRIKVLQEELAAIGKALILDLSLSYQQVLRLKQQIELKNRELEKLREQREGLKFIK